jgi:flagellar hook protein FlgE
MTLQIALSGINAASTELESISHNIANNATTGFKSSRVEFADLYASSGGNKDTQTGQGVDVGLVRQEFGQGSIEITSRNLDLAIEGLGMFRLEDRGQALYTRAGNFGLDQDGFIVNSQDQYLTGFGVNVANEIQPVIDKLKIDTNDLAPTQTTEIELAMNFDSKAQVLAPFDLTNQESYNYSTAISIYDSVGSPQLANMYFHKDAPNSWTVFSVVNGVEINQAGGDEVTFDASGTLATINGNPNPTIQTNVFNPASGASPMEITIDLSDVTQYDNEFGISNIEQDGFSAGRLEDFNIDASGVVFGDFSNGQSKRMGQVSLTNFANVGGLKQVGNTSWAETIDSGSPATGFPGSASLGSLKSGALEQSNVDLTQELVAMIGAQRSFQANAQVISTSDTITQTVINMRR